VRGRAKKVLRGLSVQNVAGSSGVINYPTSVHSVILPSPVHPLLNRRKNFKKGGFMKKLFWLVPVLLVFVVSCSRTPAPPTIETHPTSLRTIHGPDLSTKQDSSGIAMALSATIQGINEFAEGTYGFLGALDSLTDDLGDYEYSDGTWTWEWSYGVYSWRITCTESSSGYTWRWYFNGELYYEGFVNKDGESGWWKWYSLGEVYFSFEWQDTGDGGYIRWYDGDLDTGTLYISFEWTVGSNYVELSIYSFGYYDYEFTIREYDDYHGYAYVKENGVQVAYIEWDTSGNVVAWDMSK